MSLPMPETSLTPVKLTPGQPDANQAEKDRRARCREQVEECIEGRGAVAIWRLKKDGDGELKINCSLHTMEMPSEDYPAMVAKLRECLNNLREEGMLKKAADN